LVFAAAIVAAGCATAGAGPDDGSGQSADYQREPTQGGAFDIIAQGQQAAVRVPIQTAVTEQETWIDAWAALTANQSPAPERPEVSFADSTVVIIGLGERPTGGYSVSIARVVYSSSQATVEVEVERPGEEEMVTQALTTPYVIARLEGSDLEVIFAGDDVFEEFAL
jgi:hypothetical protein